VAVPAARTPRILVVRRDHIGDLVCTTPLLHALRKRLPDAWIGALVITYNAEVLARNSDVDAIYAYEKLKHGASLVENLLGRLKLRRALREKPWDYALVPSPVPRTLKLVAGLSPRWIITPSLHEGHEVERTFSLGEALGVSGTPGPVRLIPDPETQASFRQKFGSEPRVAVHFSARRPAQRWPLERYAELVRELQRTAKVFLVWSPGSKDDARHPGDDEAASQLARTGAMALPTPDLRSMIAALSLAKVVICPDGGGMHLAGGVGKPIVALFGDSPVERWRPWGVPHRIVRPASGHLRDLPLAPVLDAYFDLTAALVSR
jgi:ADP-heptose:LPS heptosyltransferase